LTDLLHRYASRQAEQRADEVALAMGDERLTYGALEADSNRLAHLLADGGCRPGDRVCLFLPKSPNAIVSMLGCLKAGCVYVPIDLASPAPRVAKIVEAADPALVLGGAAAAELIGALVAEAGVSDDTAIGSVDEPLEGDGWRSRFSAVDRDGYSDESPAVDSTVDDPAHILFTSGSTGMPKGVVITHANASQFVDWAREYFGTAPSDRISGHPPLHFDLSTWDIYGTLSAGAQLHLVPPALNLLPHKLAAFIRDAELTQWFAVPSIFTYMAKLDAIREPDFPAVERVIWCGEVMPTPILAHWIRRVPHARFTNLYGPTEATIASSYYTVPELPKSETEPIPIGEPCAGEELLVLDSELRPVPAGETGDLYIAGVGLSPGYWRDEEKTGAAFVPDPRPGREQGRIYRTGDLAKIRDDGLVLFLGRADSQIKHRGYRIELGEIETALNALNGLDECAVVAVETGGFEGTEICCAYAPAAATRLEPPELRTRLGRVLPSYMLPSRWLTLDRLPKNVNGKIDRRKIREIFEEEAEPVSGSA
jgi:amino acid adenylation domain-containing protein